MKMVQIPAGEFWMGSLPTETERFDNETRHLVRITKPFLLATTHVTVKQFATFVANTGYQTAAEKEGWAYGVWNLKENKWDVHTGASWRAPGFAQSDDHPVVDVDWNDAVAYCEWLGRKEGKRYRLPTEAEWEYACRAGASTAYPWGDDPDGGAGWANCADQTARGTYELFPPFNWSDGYLHTSPVGTFKPNAFGLYDMIGNTLQWCGDWFGDYPTTGVDDPRGAATGELRCLRGGAFMYGPKHCRCAFRGRNNPTFRNYYIGFRVAADVE